MHVHPDMKPLEFLIGRWKTEGEIKANETEPAGTFFGTDRYEWILGGQFILHTVDVVINNEKVEVMEIIGGFDANNKSYKMRSFDNQGIFTEMDAYMDKEGSVKIVGDKMRSRLSPVDNHLMIAHWENSQDNKSWFPWMDVRLSK